MELTRNSAEYHTMTAGCKIGAIFGLFSSKFQTINCVNLLSERSLLITLYVYVINNNFSDKKFTQFMVHTFISYESYEKPCPKYNFKCKGTLGQLVLDVLALVASLVQMYWIFSKIKKTFKLKRTI